MLTTIDTNTLLTTIDLQKLSCQRSYRHALQRLGVPSTQISRRLRSYAAISNPSYSYISRPVTPWEGPLDFQQYQYPPDLVIHLGLDLKWSRAHHAIPGTGLRFRGQGPACDTRVGIHHLGAPAEAGSIPGPNHTPFTSPQCVSLNRLLGGPRGAQADLFSVPLRILAFGIKSCT